MNNKSQVTTADNIELKFKRLLKWSILASLIIGFMFAIFEVVPVVEYITQFAVYIQGQIISLWSELPNAITSTLSFIGRTIEYSIGIFIVIAIFYSICALTLN